MTDTIAPAPVDRAGPTAGAPAPGPSRLRRFRTAIVLFVVFVVLLALSAWLYPSRAVVDRPAPFGLTMISARGPDVFAFDTIPLTIVPNQAYSDPSSVAVTVRPAGPDLYAVHLRWTYTPALCPAGQDRTAALAAGCAPTDPSSAITAGSLVQVSLPVGATLDHCPCQRGARNLLTERDTTVRPQAVLPDASVLTAAPQAAPVTATWDFEVHDATFAWDANGLDAEASLPVVTFQDNGNVGYGNVAVTYRIPGGAKYDWTNGPDPDKLSWTEPVSAASSAVLVSGTDNSAAGDDTRNVLIVGILLGMAGGALVGAIQEFVHAQSEEGRRRRTGSAAASSPDAG